MMYDNDSGGGAKFRQETPKQAGAELGHAQLKLGLEFTSIFCIFVFSGFNCYFIGLIEKIWFVILSSLHFKHFGKFGLIDLV